MAEKVLVVAAHPDDEVLGCGGSIARHVAQGDCVSVVFMADGVAARAGAGDAERAERKKAADRARGILGVTEHVYLGFPDNRVDSRPLLEVVQALEKVLSDKRPDIVYTHHASDLNVDHRITAQAVITACRPVPGQSVREIYAFEVLSATDWGWQGSDVFRPGVFVDIQPYLEKKMAAIQAYGLEMRAPPHTRSAENVRRLAEFRGACVGLWAAEAFHLVRRVVQASAD